MSPQLWSAVRPLEQGSIASWMRHYHELLHDVCVAAQTRDAVAWAAIRQGYDIFRAEIVAIALRSGDDYETIAFNRGGAAYPPLRFTVRNDPDGPAYVPGQILNIPDLPRFARRFPAVVPLAEAGLKSLVAAAFSSHVHGDGYIAFCSRGDQEYSMDEYTLMCLHALAAGIGFDRVGLLV
jgi:hypothetical protein